MSHLHDTGYSYFQHLIRAWRLAFILLVHGVFPDIWKTKASDEMCKDSGTRKHLLKNMYNIDETV